MEVSVGGKVFDVRQVRLRKWFDLANIQIAIQDAAESGDLDAVANQICVFLATASGEAKDLFALAFWKDVVSALEDIQSINEPSIQFPLLYTVSEEKAKDVSWDYPGRTWYVWLYQLAQKFSWTVEYIEELSLDDAVGLMQELITEDQLDREWAWGLSEMAYEYNKTTKTSKLRPLTRPVWMREKAVPAKKISIPVSMMPVGMVVDLNEMIHGRLPAPDSETGS